MADEISRSTDASRCSFVLGGGGIAADFPLEQGFGDQRKQAQEGEEGGEGEGAADAGAAVAGVEVFDFAGEGVGFTGEVLRDYGDGAEFAHGAGVAQDDAVEEAPLDVGEGDVPEGLPAIGAPREMAACSSRVPWFLAAEGDEFACDEGEGDEGGGEDQAGEGEDDADVVLLEPGAEKSGAAEDEDEDHAGDDGGDGEGDIDEGGEEGLCRGS